MQPANACCSIAVTAAGIEIDVRLEQSRKAPLPIEVTPEGINTDLKLEHILNEFESIEVTPDGIDMDGNNVHSLNAPLPMLCNLESDGNVTELSLVHP